LDGDVAVEMRQRVRIGDGRSDEGPTFDSLPDFRNADAVAGLGQRLEIADDFVPVEQRAIDSDLVTEMRPGGWHRGRQRQRDSKRYQESTNHARLSSVQRAL